MALRLTTHQEVKMEVDHAPVTASWYEKVLKIQIPQENGILGEVEIELTLDDIQALTFMLTI